MNKDSFLETLKRRYDEQIREAYVECEHEGEIDTLSLHSKLKALRKEALAEGLPVKDFEDLMKSGLSDTIRTRLGFLEGDAQSV